MAIFISFFLQFLLFVVLFNLAKSDLETKTISTWSLATVLILGLLWIYWMQLSFLAQVSSALGTGLCFWGLGVFFKKKLKTPTLGKGDILLWIFLCLFLPFEDIPLLACFTGLFGLLTARVSCQKSRDFPLVPSLVASFFITFWVKNSF